MNPERDRTTLEEPAQAALPRLFLREPGWRIVRKNGSEREFCYTIAPGQDSYHRLADGEIYLRRADEKICFPCASRRGLIDYAPRALREPVVPIDFDDAHADWDYDLRAE
jgi:hypothetical protein